MTSLLNFLKGLKSSSGNEGGFLSEKMSRLFGRNASSAFGIKGSLKAEHYRAGQVIGTYASPNYIVNAGLNEVAAMISTSGTGTKFSSIAIGTDSAATAATQTALTAEYTRTAFADAIASNTATFTATFNFTETKTIYEAGIFNHTTTAGDMLSRRTFEALNVQNGDSLVITWSITVGRS
jgi:hypothetical protein